MLREIGQLEQRRKEGLADVKKQALQTLQAGAANGAAAAKLYGQAVETTKLAGNSAKAQTGADWRKENAELLRSREMQNALQLQLRYLALSLQRGDSDDALKFAAPSLGYARDLADYLAKARGSGPMPREVSDLLNKPAAAGVFAQWLSLGPWLPAAESWEPAAGNLDGILEKNVRTPWRSAGNSELLETWDFQAKFHADEITDGGSQHAAGQFNTTSLPRLLFSKAVDAAALGMTNRAAREIFEIVQRNPAHPDFETWVTRLRGLLAASPAQP